MGYTNISKGSVGGSIYSLEAITSLFLLSDMLREESFSLFLFLFTPFTVKKNTSKGEKDTRGRRKKVNVKMSKVLSVS